MRKLLICSDLALYDPFLRVFSLLANNFNLDCHVMYPEELQISPVYLNSHLTEKESLQQDITFYSLPGNSLHVVQHGFNNFKFKKVLKEIDPDYIWVHVEFTEGLPAQFLRHYLFNSHPRIIAYFAANHLQGPYPPLFSAYWPFISRSRLKQILLWPRLDGLAACATKTRDCARRIGLPEQVPVVVNYLPVFGPEEAAEQGIELPWSKSDSFIIGFAGFLTEQKGWKVLLQALARLPKRFKVVLAGDGPQKADLLEWLKKPELQGRVHYAGLLTKDVLLATYSLFDVLVLPSISTPHIVEQFGAVLAEAMACGVAVIGSDSGAIPEVVGQGGLIFPEGDVEALAQTILRMSEDEELRRSCGEQGRQHYKNHYTCEAYAASIAKLLGVS
jgi:glycosyltransferase involved in cell wall biosynthesis